jgi:hypothetical protein
MRYPEGAALLDGQGAFKNRASSTTAHLGRQTFFGPPGGSVSISTRAFGTASSRSAVTYSTIDRTRWYWSLRPSGQRGRRQSKGSNEQHL